MIMNTHAHFTPDCLLKALATKGHLFPNIQLLEEAGKFRLSFMGKSPTRPLTPKLYDSDMRIEWMDGQSIDKQVVGGWLDSFGYDLPPEEGESWSRFLNEYQIHGNRIQIDYILSLRCRYNLESGRQELWKKPYLVVPME